MNLILKLEGNPPVWAKDAIHYYENSLKEQWIATVVEDKLLISGFDIGWIEIEFTLEQARAEMDRILAGKIDESIEYPLKKWNLAEEELLWILAVMKSSLLTMDFRRKQLIES